MKSGNTGQTLSFSQTYSTSQFEFRYLQESDYDKGMFSVLGELTSSTQPSLEDFQQFWVRQREANNKHINIVGVDRKTNRIIAFGTILIVSDVLNGREGKIENIVTSKEVRGKGLGKIIIEALKQEGWREQCNVIGLYCEDKNVKFYQKLGFKTEGMIHEYRVC